MAEMAPQTLTLVANGEGRLLISLTAENINAVAFLRCARDSSRLGNTTARSRKREFPLASTCPYVSLRVPTARPHKPQDVRLNPEIDRADRMNV